MKKEVKHILDFVVGLIGLISAIILIVELGWSIYDSYTLSDRLIINCNMDLLEATIYGLLATAVYFIGPKLINKIV